MESARKGITPTLIGLGFVVNGLFFSAIVAAEEEFEVGLALAAAAGLLGGIALLAGALRFTRGRSASGTGLSLSSVLLIAGMAGVVRHSPVSLQVGFLMFVTGFFAAATAVLFWEYRHTNPRSRPNGPG